MNMNVWRSLTAEERDWYLHFRIARSKHTVSLIALLIIGIVIGYRINGLLMDMTVCTTEQVSKWR